MNEAIQEARDTIGEFIEALENPSPDRRNLVKANVVADGASEHIWLEPVRFEDGNFIGKLANQPHRIRSIQIGSTHSCSPDEISDWAIVGADGHYFGGGFTIKVMEAQMQATGGS